MQLRRCSPSGHKKPPHARHRSSNGSGQPDWRKLAAAARPCSNPPDETSDELHSERVDYPRICQSRQRSNSCAVVLQRPQSFAFRLLSTATHTNLFSNSFLSARRPLEPNFGGTRLQYDYIFEHGFASIDGALLVFPCGEHRKC